jgi:hypothetical protein
MIHSAHAKGGKQTTAAPLKKTTCQAADAATVKSEYQHSNKNGQ